MTALTKWLSRAGICALCGSIAGAFSGFIFGLARLGAPSFHPAIELTIIVGVVLGLVAWVGILFFIGILADYGVWQIFWQALVNCELTSLLTVLVVGAIHATLSGMLIGWILGF